LNRTINLTNYLLQVSYINQHVSKRVGEAGNIKTFTTSPDFFRHSGAELRPDLTPLWLGTPVYFRQEK